MRMFLSGSCGVTECRRKAPGLQTWGYKATETLDNGNSP
jgi:hypothetical protein